MSAQAIGFALLILGFFLLIGKVVRVNLEYSLGFGGGRMSPGC